MFTTLQTKLSALTVDLLLRVAGAAPGDVVVLFGPALLPAGERTGAGGVDARVGAAAHVVRLLPLLRRRSRRGRGLRGRRRPLHRRRVRHPYRDRDLRLQLIIVFTFPCKFS